MCQGWASWRACVELSVCPCVRDGHRGVPVLSSVCVSGMGIVRACVELSVCPCVRDGHRSAPVLSVWLCVSGMGIVARLC